MAYGYPIPFKPNGFPYPTPGDPNAPQSPDMLPDTMQGLDIPQLPQRPQMETGPGLQRPQPPSSLELAHEASQDPRSGISWTGGKSLGTEGALAGLKGAQDSEFDYNRKDPLSPYADPNLQGLAQGTEYNPSSEMSLQRLASRDPNSVRPGSNAMWAGQLQDLQGEHQGIDAIQQKALEGISGAISATHPAVQFGAEAEARRRAMPAMVTGRAQLEAAKAAANSRRDVGESALQGRVQTGRYGHLDTIMQAIRAIRGKANVTAQDNEQLRALMSLYDIMAEPLTGATFDEATQDLEP